MSGVLMCYQENFSNECECRLHDKFLYYFCVKNGEKVSIALKTEEIIEIKCSNVSDVDIYKLFLFNRILKPKDSFHELKIDSYPLANTKLMEFPIMNYIEHNSFRIRTNGLTTFRWLESFFFLRISPNGRVLN